MNIEEIRDYCLAKSGITVGFPFGGDVLVFKVMNKIFALTGLDGGSDIIWGSSSLTTAMNWRCRA